MPSTRNIDEKYQIFFNFLHRARLPFTVFTTGACILIVEIAASRILAPYFGNTIFTFSSIIGTVLLALSVGYYAGGKLADCFPSYEIFSFIILLSGSLVFLLTGVSVTLLPYIGYSVSLVFGPLIISFALFFIPCVFMGFLSPYAVKLAHIADVRTGIGSVAGSMFFWSTLGSIVGTVLAGFVFIPFLGVRLSLIAVSILLTLLGLSGIRIRSLPPLLRRWGMLLPVLSAGLGVAMLLAEEKAEAVIFEHDGVYERIQVQDGHFRGRPARLLVMDRSLASAQYPHSDEPVFPYANYVYLHRLFDLELERALVIGAGAYKLPILMREEWPEATIDSVDIEPVLEQVAKDYFRYEPDDRMRSFTVDGRRFLYDSEERYDLIFLDAYSSLFALPSHMATKEFFEIVESRLTETGVVIANIIASPAQKEPSLLSTLTHTMRSVWPGAVVFATEAPNQAVPQNMIVLAGHTKDVDPCDTRHRLSSHSAIATLCEQWLQVNTSTLTERDVFTDDRNPVDWIAAGLMNVGK